MSPLRSAVVAGLLFSIVVANTSVAQTQPLTMSTPPKADATTSPVTAQSLAPALCAGKSLVNIFAATSGTVSGGAGNDLVLGRNTATTINGGGGTDCLIGGGGNDSMNGQAGTGDVCIGNGGTDTFNAACETQVQ